MSLESTSGPVDPVAVMLDGLISDVPLDELHDRVGESFRYGSATTARGLLDLASAFLACGASGEPLESVAQRSARVPVAAAPRIESSVR